MPDFDSLFPDALADKERGKEDWEIDADKSPERPKQDEEEDDDDPRNKAFKLPDAKAIAKSKKAKLKHDKRAFGDRAAEKVVLISNPNAKKRTYENSKLGKSGMRSDYDEDDDDWDNFEMLREVQSWDTVHNYDKNVYMYHNHREFSSASRANPFGNYLDDVSHVLEIYYTPTNMGAKELVQHLRTRHKQLKRVISAGGGKYLATFKTPAAAKNALAAQVSQEVDWTQETIMMRALTDPDYVNRVIELIPKAKRSVSVNKEAARRAIFNGIGRRRTPQEREAERKKRQRQKQARKKTKEIKDAW